MPTELRITLQWDTDGTDVELTVREPNEQCCSMMKNRTSNGGFMTRNFTKGLGPVEYTSRKLLPGVYTVEVKLFHGQQKSGTTACLNIWTNYGNIALGGKAKKPEVHKCIVTRLESSKQSVLVAVVVVAQDQ